MTAPRPRSGSRRAARLAIAGLVVVAATIAAHGSAFAVGRVSPAPAAFTVTEGGATQDVVFRLDEPIIGSSGPTGVDLAFSIDDPSRLSLSPTTLHWDESDWTQTRTLTVTPLHDGVYDPSDTVTVHVTTTSGSEYYDGYTTSFTATINDIDPAPPTTSTSTTTSTSIAPTTTTPAGVAPASTGSASTTPTTAATGPQLATTGSANANATLAGVLLLLMGAALLAISGDAARRRWAGFKQG